MQPTVTWNEAQPPISQSFSLGDDRIREFKKQFREIFGADHNISSTGGNGDDWGYHNQITLIEQAAYPPAVTDTFIYFTKEVNSIAELHFIDEDSHVMQLTEGEDFIGGMAGEIRMWNGTLATIPTGWSLCDGTGSKPNLIAKFIRGVASSSWPPGPSSVGQDTVSLTSYHLPNHTHPSVTSASAGTHTHGYVKSQSGPVSVSYGGNTTRKPTTSYGTQTGNNTFNHGHVAQITSNVGGTTTIDNKPAYYEVAFIIRG
jgi:microcystin-dependent protein